MPLILFKQGKIKLTYSDKCECANVFQGKMADSAAWYVQSYSTNLHVINSKLKPAKPSTFFPSWDIVKCKLLSKIEYILLAILYNSNILNRWFYFEYDALSSTFLHMFLHTI